MWAGLKGQKFYFLAAQSEFTDQKLKTGHMCDTQVTRPHPGPTQTESAVFQSQGIESICLNLGSSS